MEHFDRCNFCGDELNAREVAELFLRKQNWSEVSHVELTVYYKTVPTHENNLNRKNETTAQEAKREYLVRRKYDAIRSFPEIDTPNLLPSEREVKN